MTPLATACALLRTGFAGSFARSSALIRQKRKNAAVSRSKLLSTSGLASSQDVTVSAGSPALPSSAGSSPAAGAACAECCIRPPLHFVSPRPAEAVHRYLQWQCVYFHVIHFSGVRSKTCARDNALPRDCLDRS